MTRRRRGGAGTVLWEACLLTLPVVAGLFLLGELARRAPLELALHHGAFLTARDRRLGVSDASRREGLARWLRGALGGAAGPVLRTLDVTVAESTAGTRARLHYRFEAFLRFPWGDGEKHHFEVTKACLFP